MSVRPINRLLAALGAAFALLAGGAPAWGAIGTPQSIGVAYSSTSGTSIALTTTGTASPAGALVFVAVSTTSAGGVPSLSDSVGNSYVPIGSTMSFGTAGKHTLFYVSNALALPTGSVITATWSGTAKPVITAFSVTGVATSSALDVVTAVSTGTALTGVSPAVSSGGLGQADELVLGYTGVDDNPGAWTRTSGWTALSNAGGLGNNETWLEYRVVSSASAVSSAPTWTNARNYGALIVTFKAAGAAPPPSTANRMLLLGVGQ